MVRASLNALKAQYKTLTHVTEHLQSLVLLQMSNVRDATKRDSIGSNRVVQRDIKPLTLDYVLPHAQKELVMQDIWDVLETIRLEDTQELDAQKDPTLKDSCAGSHVQRIHMLELDQSVGTNAQQTHTHACMELFV